MKKRVKNLWVNALESGEYAQGTGALCKPGRKGDAFCCLGVLCDLYAHEKNQVWEETSDGDLSMHGNAGCLPEQVMRWAGLDSPNPSVRYRGSWTNQRSLASINDGSYNDDGSFKNIAKLVKKYL